MRFIVASGAAESRRAAADAVITEHSCDAAQLVRELKGADDVLLHYAARAYQRFGVPFWLARALERWRKANPNARLAVFFHELPAQMPLLSRHYLPNVLNESMVRRIARIADAVATNTEEQANALRRISGRDDVRVIGVFANIEPPDNRPPLRTRGEFVLFGLPFGRLQTLERFSASLRHWRELGLITRLHIIGPDDRAKDEQAALDRSHLRDIAVVHSILSAADISPILLSAAFALTNVTPQTWTKSTVFMSCAAHRCAVVADVPANAQFPLNAVIRPAELPTIDATEIERRAAVLHEWYVHHASRSVVAQQISDLFARR